MGNMTEFGIVVGRNFSGKTELATQMQNKLGYKVIDMKAITERVKASLGTEDEPFEGEVKIEDVEKEVVAFINS